MPGRGGYWIAAGIVWVVLTASAGYGQTTAPSEDLKTNLLPALALLEHGEYKQALPTLQALQQAYSRSTSKPDECRILASHALAYALWMTKEEKKAQSYMDQAIGMAVSSHIYSRSLAINAAKMDIAGEHRTDYPRDAAYLIALLNLAPTDEHLIDLVGILLDRASSAPEIAMPGVRDRYNQLSTELEKQRPSLRRWGVVWVSAADYNILDHDLADTLGVLRGFDRKLDELDQQQRQYNTDIKAADRANSQARRDKLSSNITGADPAAAQGRMNSAQDTMRSIQQRIEAARQERLTVRKDRDRAVDKPIWPKWNDESPMALPLVDAERKQPPPPMQKLPFVLVDRSSEREATDSIVAAPPMPEGRPKALIPAATTAPTETGAKASGSGFFVTSDGYLITSYHVVDGGAAIIVKTDNGLVIARIVAKDPENDLALLKVDGQFTAISFAVESTAKPGQTVFAVGYPMLGSQESPAKVNRGVIGSATGFREDVRRYRIDAGVQPGNAGGPLVDENGSVVGVVVARSNATVVVQQTGTSPQNVDYAVKKSYVLMLISSNSDASMKVNTVGVGTHELSEDAIGRVRKATVPVLVY